MNPGKFMKETMDRFSIAPTLNKKLREYFNMSQMKAIEHSLKKEGVTLI